MEFEIIAFSSITKRKGDQHHRAIIPLEKVVRELKLENDLKSSGYFYSYRIMDVKDRLILAVPDLSSEEIKDLNDLFEMRAIVNHFVDIRVYHYNKKKKTSFIMNLDPRVLSYLNTKNFIYWAKFQVKERTHLLIRGDMKIRLDF